MSAASDALVAGLTATAEAVRTACSDPLDAIRLLAELAAYVPATPNVGAAPIGAAIVSLADATAEMCRVAALTSLATACTQCTPGSADDARALLALFTGLADAEILRVADAGMDATYLALCAMRATVADDLTTRAAALPFLRPVVTNEPTPATVLAYRLYGDATREDGLVALVDPIHPGFMPTSFEALSS